jgi:hypothetical protein
MALLVYTTQRQQSRASAREITQFHLAVYQEEPPVKWESIEPKPLTAALKISMLLNLPSLFLAIPFVAILRHGSDMGVLYAAMPYGIGRWLDGMLRYVRKRWWLPRSLSGSTALLSTGLLILSAYSVTPLYHHRRPDTYWVGTPLILWSGLALAMSLSSFYRRPQQLA